MPVIEPGSMFSRGQWQKCDTYDPGDVVLRAGIFFIAIRQSAGFDPLDAVSENYWKVFASTIPDGGGGGAAFVDPNTGTYYVIRFADGYPVLSPVDGDTLLYRGPFDSLAALAAARPTDVPGAYATVLTESGPAMYLWNAAAGEWQDSGLSGVFVLSVNGRIGPSVNLVAADIPGAERTANKNIPNGYAGLNASGLLPWGKLDITNPETGEQYVIKFGEDGKPALSLSAHANIEGREAADSHPMAAITGLDSALDGKVDKTASSTGEWVEGIDVEQGDPDTATVRVYSSKLDGSGSGIESEKTLYGAVAPGADPEADPGEAGLMTASDKALLDSLPGQVGSLTGKLRYMPANDFGAAAPAPADLTAWATDHTGLDHVENSTAVVNLYDNHEWIYNETGDEWIDNGLSSVQAATNASLGVVMGGAADWKVSVGDGGAMSVNTVDASETAKGIVQLATAEEIMSAAPPGDKTINAAQFAANGMYYVGEIYPFFDLHPGFALANGGLIENADVDYAILWAWLQTPKGQARCVTQEEWDAMNSADPWLGVGGVTSFVIDLGAKTIRVPDVRGMYREFAGFDGLVSGGAHGDMTRNFTGKFSVRGCTINAYNGVFGGDSPWAGAQPSATGYTEPAYANIDISRQVPTGNANKPRAFGAHPCLYVGGA